MLPIPSHDLGNYLVRNQENVKIEVFQLLGSQLLVIPSPLMFPSLLDASPVTDAQTAIFEHL